jgi:hypothetical protein
MPFLLRGFTLFMFLFRIWRRLPPSQRRRVLYAAGRHAPKLASVAMRYARARRRFP